MVSYFFQNTKVFKLVLSNIYSIRNLDVAKVSSYSTGGGTKIYILNNNVFTKHSPINIFTFFVETNLKISLLSVGCCALKMYPFELFSVSVSSDSK